MDQFPLKQYQSKRSFPRTPEPESSQLLNKANYLYYVVQEHAASHHHFDLRLQLKNVLKSWAVPKGVPTQKGVKRLAMMVEDHPLDYMLFHGDIPKGLYGAGQVKIWDIGFLFFNLKKNKEDNESLFEKELEKQKLHFYLFGKKLKAWYTMFSLKKDNQWIILKTH